MSVISLCSIYLTVSWVRLGNHQKTFDNNAGDLRPAIRTRLCPSLTPRVSLRRRSARTCADENSRHAQIRLGDVPDGLPRFEAFLMELVKILWETQFQQHGVKIMHQR